MAPPRECRPTDTTPEVAAVPARLTIFYLDTLKPAGEIPGVGGNGTAVDPKTNHGFTSDHPQGLDVRHTKTLTLIKSIERRRSAYDGIYFDPFNQRVSRLQPSHQRRTTVIDFQRRHRARHRRPRRCAEQGVENGKGMLYVVMQDAVGGVTAVDVKTMKAVGHPCSFVNKGGCNGLAIDVKNQILFAACNRSGNPPHRSPTSRSS